MKPVKSLLLEYKFIFAFFVPFILVHVFYAALVPWDPIAYLFQGKWFCGQKIYLEFLRAPLPGVINCLSGAGNYSTMISQLFSGFLYLAATLFLYNKLKKTQAINQPLFAAFAFLFPTILMDVGSDVLALSFFLLALAIDSPWKKGFFYGLATLSRYNYFLFAVVLLYQLKLKPKEWAKFALPAFLLWLPWLWFNFAETGNAFFSLDEMLYLNVIQKGLAGGWSLEAIAVAAFFIIAVCLTGLRKNLSSGTVQLSLIGLLQFAAISIKELRFFNAAVPAQAEMISRETDESKKYRGLFALLLVIFIAVFALTTGGYFLSGGGVKEIPSNDFIRECAVMSDQWVLFYPKGIVAEPLPGSDAFQYFLSEGYSLAISKNTKFDFSGLYGFEFVEAKDFLILKSGKCRPQPESYALKVWRGAQQ
ncbi:MAG: hypothetical protein V1494_02760 [Candidatus Diapherotrites archaeon]